MHDTHRRIAAALIDIEQALRELQLWQAQPPSPEALNSSQPFCIDTLTFVQWLQFVFLPRMSALVEGRQPLPGQCGIAPMAAEYFKGMGLNARPLVEQLKQIDRILGGD